MSDDAKPTGEAEGTQQPSGSGENAGEKPTGAQTTTTTTPDDFDAERAMNTIRAQREAEKALKARIRELEDAVKPEPKQAEPKANEGGGDDPVAAFRAELEAIRNELTQERTARTEAEQRNAFTAAAQSEGVRPEATSDLYAVLKAEGADLTDIPGALRGLRETKPFYFGPARKSGGADGAAGNGGQPGPELTADEVRFAKMFGLKPEQYAQNK